MQLLELARSAAWPTRPRAAVSRRCGRFLARRGGGDRSAVAAARGGGDWVIEPLPKHDEIAAWAGVEVSEVAHAIGKLAREKVLERQNRTLVIHDRAKIHEMSGM